MPPPTLAPRFSVTADRLHGCTNWVARLLTLFSYGRCVSVNKRLRHLIVSTQRLWILHDVRVINFDRISRIVYRAQALPSLAPWRYWEDAPTSGWAFFVVGLALKDEPAEVQLFTLWQAQPHRPDLLDRLAGETDSDHYTGDEAACSLINTLMQLTGARIAAR